MTAEIHVLHKWGATACLEAAKQQVPNDEKVIVCTYDKDGQSTIYSANVNHSEALWLLSHCSQKVLNNEF